MDWIWRYFERNVRGSAIVNWGAYTSVLVLLAMAIHLLTPARPDIELALEPRQDSCEHEFVRSSDSDIRLRILTRSEISGQTICRILPTLSDLLGAYDGVHVRWAADGRWDQAISERRFQLVQARSEQLDVLKTTIGDYYQKVAYHPAYAAYFVSTGQAPELSESYFNDRTLGLRADVRSRSGYILPMRALNDQGIEIGDRIARYGSHEELRRALEQGEVDVIGTHWSVSEGAKYPNWRATRIDDVATGLSWYVGGVESADLKIQCELVALLSKAAEESTSIYFSDLLLVAEIERACRAVG